MSSPSRRIPKYRLHKPTGQAVVRLNNQDVYLGVHNTPESQELYDRVIAEWLVSHRVPTRPTRKMSGSGEPGCPDLTIAELLRDFLLYADQHFRDQDGRPTGELENFKVAIRPLHRLYKTELVRRFGPLALRAVREKMIALRQYQIRPVGGEKAVWMDADKVRLDEGLAQLKKEKWLPVEVVSSRPALSRNVINARINRIKRVFKWGTSMEKVPAGVYEALRTVAGLEAGRTSAHETPGILPVPVGAVKAALPMMPPPIAGLVQFQLLTGCRVSEALILRGVDIDQSGPVWIYRPHRHKTLHRGGKRVIFLGPQVQEVLRPFLNAEDPTTYLFSPARWTAQRNAERIAKRKTKRQPSQQLTKRRKKAPLRKPSARYTPRTYRQAVRRACKKANVAPWNPLQLRHTRATELRALYGVEAARVILGHSKVETTQIYAERDLERASQIMGQVG